MGQDEKEMEERNRRRQRGERDKCRWDWMKKRWRKDTEEDITRVNEEEMEERYRRRQRGEREISPGGAGRRKDVGKIQKVVRYKK